MSEEKQTNKKTNYDILQLAIICICIFVIAVAIFGAGVFIGGMRAKFSYRWAENYHKNFAGPREGFLKHWPKPLPPPGDFIEGYGSFGEIIELNDSGFVIKGRKNIEKIIVIIEDTVIKKGRETITEGLKIGDKVTVIGSPNEQGQIEAKLIRIFDEEKIKMLPMSPPPHFF